MENRLYSHSCVIDLEILFDRIRPHIMKRRQCIQNLTKFVMPTLVSFLHFSKDFCRHQVVSFVAKHSAEIVSLWLISSDS